MGYNNIDLVRFVGIFVIELYFIFGGSLFSFDIVRIKFFGGKGSS